MPRSKKQENIWSKSLPRIRTTVRRSTPPADTMRRISMAQDAVTRRFRMATIWIIWSMDACTIRTAIIATITARCRGFLTKQIAGFVPYGGLASKCPGWLRVS